jgi:hypothetical protein
MIDRDRADIRILGQEHGNGQRLPIHRLLRVATPKMHQPTRDGLQASSSLPAPGQRLGEHKRGGGLESAAKQIGGAGRLKSQGPPVLATRVDLGEFHPAPRLRAQPGARATICPLPSANRLIRRLLRTGRQPAGSPLCWLGGVKGKDHFCHDSAGICTGVPRQPRLPRLSLETRSSRALSSGRPGRSPSTPRRTRSGRGSSRLAACVQGFYSNDLLDNLGHPSATAILPALQHLTIGQWVPCTTGSTR